MAGPPADSLDLVAREADRDAGRRGGPQALKPSRPRGALCPVSPGTNVGQLMLEAGRHVEAQQSTVPLRSAWPLVLLSSAQYTGLVPPTHSSAPDTAKPSLLRSGMPLGRW